MTPAFVTACTALPPEGADFARGGPSQNCPPQPAYQHNGKTISAEAFYAIACDPRRNVAVEACAGAGKTWMLVSRIVRALLDATDFDTGELKVQPHEILAITFTKRAASEMRERLYQWLAEFAGADGATLARELQMRGCTDKNGLQPSPLQLKQLSNLYQKILATGRQVQIRTFHSWFAALLRSAPLALLQQLDLPPNYELLEDDAPAKALVWRRFYAALAASPERKADFEAVVFEHGRFQCEKALAVALDKRIEFLLADAQGVVDDSVLTFAGQFPEFAGFDSPDDAITADAGNFRFMQNAAQALGRASAPTFVAKGVELEQALTAGKLDAAFAALLTKEGTPRKFSEKMAGLNAIRAAQDLVLKVVAARHQHAAWAYQQRMARLSRVLIAEFGALKRERGWVDMNDVERAALAMLGDPVLSGWVQQRLDARIKHLLIDEFQDTNPLQWQALLSWLSGYAGAGGGATAPSVFIVGDPKQSIYRFRRAEPQVFKAAQAFVRDGLGGDLLSCDHTRRNATQIIATVNAAMGQARDVDGYEGFREHTTSSSEAGRVCKLPPVPRVSDDAFEAGGGINVHAAPSHDAPWRDSLTTPRELPEETLRTLEARQAAAWIARLIAGGDTGDTGDSGRQTQGEGGRHGSPRGGLQPQDIMVLSRKRSGLAPLQDELRALHIAAQIGEKTELIDCCEVQDIVALLDVLVSPQHDLSLARVLKSPLFGLGDEALVKLALLQQQAQLPFSFDVPHGARHDIAREMPHEISDEMPRQMTHTAPPVPWLDLLRKSDLTMYDGRGLEAVFILWKGWIDTLPPHDALQAIYGDGDVLARFAIAAPAAQREAVLANLRALLGVSLQLGGGRYATPYALVRALKAGGVQAPAAVVENAVRLLTIHGAKGLEAHTVLLLDTDTAPRKADTMGVLVDWPGESAAPRKFVFLASESQPPACAVETLAVETAERQREELNALYVALTRARQTLAISSITPYRESGQSWWTRLSGLARDVEDIPINPPPLGTPAGPPGSGSLQSTAPPPATGLFVLKELPPAPVGIAYDAINNISSAAADAAATHGGYPPDEHRDADADAIKRSGGSGAQGSASARRGQAMHRLLEWGSASATNIHAAMREFDLTPGQGSEAADMARRILAGEGAWAWDAARVGWQGNEVELNYQGGTLRLDRLVQRSDTGEWWVLDYKSPHAPQDDPALVNQLQNYRDAVRAIYPEAAVRAAFLTAAGKLVELRIP